MCSCISCSCKDLGLFVLLNLAHVYQVPDSSGGRESACSAGDPGSIPGSGSCWRRDRLPTPVFLGFPYGSAGEESA